MDHGSAGAVGVFVESVAARGERNRTRGHPRWHRSYVDYLYAPRL